MTMARMDDTARLAVEGVLAHDTAQEHPPAANENAPVRAQEGSAPRFGDWMQTFTGRAVYPLDLRPDEIDIRDIAHSLAMQCRYAGHCLRFYSVAEHSVLIARWLKEAGYSHEVQLAGLMHDAPEAYLVDVPRPIKPFLTGYREAEDRAWTVISERYGLGEIPGAVHRADSRILGDERAQNMKPTDDDWRLGEPLGVTLECWSPGRAEHEFLALFSDLYGED